MTDVIESPLEALSGLLEERRRYEGWLAQLEERRAASPSHVVDRVRSDYLTRLDGVMTQLRGRAADLESSASALRERIESLEAEERRRRDERSETELRSLVGEFDTEHAESAMSACDAAVTQLSEERERHSAELARVVDVLASVAAPTPQELAELAEQAELAELAALSAARDSAALATQRDADDALAAVDAASAAAADARAARAHAESLASASAATAEASRSNSAQADAERARSVIPANDAAQLDELAFLQSVVEPREQQPSFEQRGSATAAPARAAETHSDLLPQPVLAAPRRSATPLGAPPISSSRDAFTGQPKGPSLTPGSMPSFFKDMPTEQVKTLKCQECGTMNYPTEWYCERCGGELAAM